MQTFSDLARRYDVYILGSNNQTEFRESVDPTEIEKFADPDVADPTSAFVATGPEVYNEAFMWAPRNVTADGPRPLRNVVASNKKVPLTSIEQLISLTPGPSTGPDAIENVRPYRIPGTKARMSFATSLPAFVYNGGAVTPFGEAPGPGIDPCSDTSKYYMYCLDALGTNLVMQDEANPGEWATQSGWQPLEWMSSTWRSSADPTVDFDYNVTPHMVGNLADLPFDGQTAITQRGLKGPRGVKPSKASCNYVGDSEFLPEDPPEYEVYAGPKREFLGLAPWARAGCFASEAARDRRRAGAGLGRSARERLPRDGRRRRPPVPAGSAPRQLLGLSPPARCAIIGGRWRTRHSRCATPTGGRSPTSGCRSPTAATSAASTACPPTGCRGSSATRSSRSRRSSGSSRCSSGSASRTSA